MKEHSGRFSTHADAEVLGISLPIIEAVDVEFDSLLDGAIKSKAAPKAEIEDGTWQHSCIRLVITSLLLAGLSAVYIAAALDPGLPPTNQTQNHSSASTTTAINATSVAADESILWRALSKAMRSGTGGFVAGAMQVFAFMWLRTAMNYQYKFGGSLLESFKSLYREGGIRRFYQGLFPWAIMQNPLARFGSIFSNELVVALALALLPSLPVSISTFAGSVVGSFWRIVITPIGTCKTIMQTDGSNGSLILKEKMQRGGVRVLWAGWEGNWLASLLGNYPWFAALNQLQQTLPVPQGKLLKLVRNAVIGAIASSVSDIVSNSLRVVTTVKQTHPEQINYFRAVREVTRQDGLFGLFSRGLETRIYTNVLQSAFFTVVWKYLAG